MARRQVADGGEGLQIWRLAANILNKQSRTTDKGPRKWMEGQVAGSYEHGNEPSGSKNAGNFLTS
jgi:hypothetical protein